jgi:hypothetical protein
MFVPPEMWYHQHFNVGEASARYLAFHPITFKDFLKASPEEQEAFKQQIPYTDEDPWIRQKFEEELAKRNLTSLMPEEVYKDRNFQWKY